MSASVVAQWLELADSSLKAGELDRAVACFDELERIENDPEWPRRAAELHRMRGDPLAQAEALNRAARLHAERHEILKAAVLSKQILALNPKHVETLKRIPELVAARKAELSRPRSSQRAHTPVSAMREEAIAALRLRDVMPHAASATPGVYAIELHGQVGSDQPLQLTLKKAVEEEVRTAETATDALKSTLFAELDPKTFQALLMHAQVVELKNGQTLFRQGDPADALYVIAHGTCGVIDEGPPRRGVAKIGEGQFFGEIALITDQPRTATIVALTDVQLIAVDRRVVRSLTEADAEFLEILLRFFRDRSVDTLMTTNPLFTVLSDSDRRALKPRFRFLEVEPGAVLIEEGKKADGLLIMLAGRAEVTRDQAAKRVVLGQLKSGDIAGEISLLTNLPAIGTVRAIEKSLVIELPAVAFQKIVHARSDAMSFVQQVIDQRVARAQSIIDGKAPHGEGNIGGV